MNKTTFVEGASVALAVSIIGSAAYTVGSPLFGTSVSLRLLVSALGLVYCIYLLSRKDNRIGSTTVTLVYIVVTISLWLFDPPLLFYIVIHTAMIWLVRAFYIYKSVFCALFDFVLSASSLITAVWVVAHSKSLFLGIWSFFLMQAFFVFIPTKITKPKLFGFSSHIESDRFEQAHKSAEAALAIISRPTD